TYGAVNVTDGGRFSPGNSPGSVTTGDGTTWGAGGTYQWEINDAAGTLGGPAGWDVWNVAGDLGITAGTTANTKFTIAIPGLPAAGYVSRRVGASGGAPKT